jgi:hypothetical protein
VDSGDWAIQRVDECIVGCPCRFCPDRNLGLYAIGLMPQQALLGLTDLLADAPTDCY